MRLCSCVVVLERDLPSKQSQSAWMKRKVGPRTSCRNKFWNVCLFQCVSIRRSTSNTHPFVFFYFKLLTQCCMYSMYVSLLLLKLSQHTTWNRMKQKRWRHFSFKYTTKNKVVCSIHYNIVGCVSFHTKCCIALQALTREAVLVYPHQSLVLREKEKAVSKNRIP